MKFNINELNSKLNKIDTDLKKLDSDKTIKKYGSFLDSKKEIVQLYILFIFFGIHGDIISQYPSTSVYSVTPEYDPD